MEQRQNISKKPNKMLYTLSMIILTVFIQYFVIWGYGSNAIITGILSYPQGKLLLLEGVLAGLCLIVMLLFGNSYVFTEKKEKLKVGLFYGLYYIICGCIFLFMNRAGLKYPMSVLNLALGCFFIGVCEEFLCRGFLLNEFLERFGNNSKGVWYSIITSGVMFGALHFGNLLGGQSLLGTIIQVISASVSGITFGLIYYKTKNIWSVILLHAFWDFTIMLSSVIPITENMEFKTIAAISLLANFVIGFAELPYIFAFKNINEKPKKAIIIVLAIVCSSIIMVCLMIEKLFTIPVGEKYEYKPIKLENYEIINSKIDKYKIKENNIYITLNDDYHKLIIKNENTNYESSIPVNNLVDYSIAEFDDYYLINYIDYKRGKPFLYYKEIPKTALSNYDIFIECLTSDYNEYLLPEKLKILGIYDYDNDVKYLGFYDQDYGYYLLKENKVYKLYN